MKPIEHLLRQTIGLDAASIGSTLIERAVRLRMKARGLKKLEDYQRLLASSSAEWDELVESVIVTETWFFRDQEPFAALACFVRERWLRAPAAAPARLLSVPCSSGEEPYSLVMALLDAGVPRDRFQLDAADLSARALASAKRAVYSKNSFRGKDLEFRDRHFQSIKEGFVLNPALRSGVGFYQGNLLSEAFLADKGTYDFIFCRNLLIYFDRLTQQRALQKIASLLAPAGVLFVGPAELPLVSEHGFVSANMPMAFACCKADNGQAPAALPHLAAGALRPPRPTAPTQPNGESPPVLPGADAKLPAADKPAQGPPTDLETARRLADAGRLKEAAEICEVHLRRYGASAQAYYLLGLVRDARSDPGALDCYRRALYLEPDHYETLLQMALWSQKNGDVARARTFKRRAQRIKLKL